MKSYGVVAVLFLSLPAAAGAQVVNELLKKALGWTA